MKQRILHFDLIRLVACLMVVAMHSPMPGDSVIGAFTSGLTYVTMPCIGLFFTLSGALLLPVQTPPPTQVAGLEFVRRKVTKFLPPVLIWSVVYLIADGTLLSADVDQIARSLLSIPFRRQEGVLWFMYVLTGLYLVAPIISPWLQQTDKKTLQFYLMLWGISLMYPLLKPFVDIEESVYGVLYYLSGYVGYFLLGYYLKRYGLKVGFAASIVLVGLMTTLPALYKVFVESYELGFGEIFWYLSIDSAILVVLWWNILEHISKRLEGLARVKSVCATLGNLSFGVYLCHVLIMRYWLWQNNLIGSIENYILQTIAIILSTAVCSFLLAYVLSKTPLGLPTICYKSK